ncbi:MAG: hypothetical protein Q4C59_13480, partial [Lachnospiraceae bacterium]|nr:hypothetical protein [Lachnospiraceae bacterium]
MKKLKDKYKKQMPVRTEACEEKAARILPGGGEPDSGTYAYAAGRGGSDEFKSCPVGGAEPGGMAKSCRSATITIRKQ